MTEDELASSDWAGSQETQVQVLALAVTPATCMTLVSYTLTFQDSSSPSCSTIRALWGPDGAFLRGERA